MNGPDHCVQLYRAQPVRLTLLRTSHYLVPVLLFPFLLLLRHSQLSLFGNGDSILLFRSFFLSCPARTLPVTLRLSLCLYCFVRVRKRPPPSDVCLGLGTVILTNEQFNIFRTYKQTNKQTQEVESGVNV